MLPPVANFDSTASVCDMSTQTTNMEHLATLLPSLDDFKQSVRMLARQYRNTESFTDKQANFANPESSCMEQWGNPRNGRKFERTPSGCAFYEFRPGETLGAVARDLIDECKKNNPSLGQIDYEATRIAVQDILAFNNISDADFIEPGSKLIIPSSLVPVRGRVA